MPKEWPVPGSGLVKRACSVCEETYHGGTHWKTHQDGPAQSVRQMHAEVGSKGCRSNRGSIGSPEWRETPGGRGYGGPGRRKPRQPGGCGLGSERDQ